ncbi:hypothetical protein D8Y24_09115 [Agrococcus lahaulensis]|nr:hypothetical protein D8Y24_09115 [Agrococcus lahaulensis]
MMGTIVLIAPSRVFELFVNEEPTVDILRAIALVGATAPIIWVSAVTAAYLRAWRESNKVLISSFVATWLVQVPVAWFLAIEMQLGLLGAFIAYLGYHACRAFVQIVAIVCIRRRSSERGLDF